MTTTLLPDAGSAIARPGVGAAAHHVASRLETVGAIALASSLCGLAALGAGSRIAMRLVALTSGRIGTGIRPDSGAVPGEFTVDGTVFLLLAGTVLGGVLGVAVAAGLGPWLPRRPRLRWLATAALTALLPVLVLVDPGNPDFGRFGPRWFAVPLFLSVGLLYGAAVASLAPRVRSRPRGRVRRVVLRMLGVAATFPVLLLGLGAPGSAMLGLPAVLLLLVGLFGPSEPPTARWAASAWRGAGVLVLVAATAAAAGLLWRVAAMA